MPGNGGDSGAKRLAKLFPIVRYMMGFQLSSGSYRFVHRSIHRCGEPISESTTGPLAVSNRKSSRSSGRTVYEGLALRLKNAKTRVRRRLLLNNCGQKTPRLQAIPMDPNSRELLVPPSVHFAEKRKHSRTRGFAAVFWLDPVPGPPTAGIPTFCSQPLTYSRRVRNLLRSERMP